MQRCVLRQNVAVLRRYLETQTDNRMRRTVRQPHRMPVQRYDVRDADGGFVDRYWQPVNTPLSDATGTIVHILHHVEPVAEWLWPPRCS